MLLKIFGFSVLTMVISQKVPAGRGFTQRSTRHTQQRSGTWSTAKFILWWVIETSLTNDTSKHMKTSENVWKHIKKYETNKQKAPQKIWRQLVCSQFNNNLQWFGRCLRARMLSSSVLTKDSQYSHCFVLSLQTVNSERHNYPGH